LIDLVDAISGIEERLSMIISEVELPENGEFQDMQWQASTGSA
jgi:hypothetical protein